MTNEKPNLENSCTAVQKVKSKRQKIYVQKVHLYLSKNEYSKLNEDTKSLELNKSELVRELINDDFVYCNLFVRLIFEFKKQGANLNQIAKHVNETSQAGEEIIDSLNNIKKYYSGVLSELKKC